MCRKTGSVLEKHLIVYNSFHSILNLTVIYKEFCEFSKAI